MAYSEKSILAYDKFMEMGQKFFEVKDD